MLVLCIVVGCALCLAGDTAHPPAPGLPDAQQLIEYVNQSIAWRRGVGAQEAIVIDPSDLLFFNDSRRISDQILQLSFDFARPYAQYLSQQKTSQPSQSDSSANNQSLTQMAANADNEAHERQDQLQELRRSASRARGKARAKLNAEADAMQSEVQLEQARAETLRTLLQFSGGAAGGGSLLGQVNEMARSAPQLDSGANQAQKSAGSATAAPLSRPPQPAGIVAITESLIIVRRKSSTLANAVLASNDLATAAQKLRRPLVTRLTDIAEQGDKAVTASGTSDDYNQRKQQLDALTAEFKQLSGILLPLGKQAILLDSYRANLDRWQQAVETDYQTELKTLAVRLIILGLVLFVVIALAELWRKVIFAYVHDARRRYQFLVMRRIILWIAIAIAIAFALASQIGSLATFVGLLTAGIAVALQNVILAIAGYFFLIGKYGVRVGDRVQIASVTGIVVDIGLVRLHLMELSSPETGRQPTGRVVVFSNAVVFQAGASFYKQIPGTNFTWHEVRLTLAPDTDYHAAEQRMLHAVESVYEKYRDRMEHQHRVMQESLSVEVALPRPHLRLHLTNTGLEVVIRFPTELENSSEMDDAVARELLRAIEEAPRLRLVGSGTPTIQPAPEKPAGTPQPKSA
jgi:small-conductance mechanosensitive channel